MVDLEIFILLSARELEFRKRTYNILFLKKKKELNLELKNV